jgi:hypothetical protein
LSPRDFSALSHLRQQKRCCRYQKRKLVRAGGRDGSADNDLEKVDENQLRSHAAVQQSRLYHTFASKAELVSLAAVGQRNKLEGYSPIV